MLLFSGTIRGIMAVINRSPISADDDDGHCKTLVAEIHNTDKNYYTLRDYNSILIGPTVVIQWEDGEA